MLDTFTGNLRPAIIRPESIFTSASAVSSYSNCLVETDLRGSFLTALNKIQPYKFHFDQDGTLPFLNFGEESVHNPETLKHLLILEELPDNWKYLPQEIEQIKGHVRGAFQILKDLDPEVFSAFQVLIGTLVFGRKAHYDGGSLSSLIGAIWVGLSPDQADLDYAELILHEFVHHALFLDDMVNRIFLVGEARLAQSDGLVQSAILKIRRGYDKAFHSAFVAFVLAQLYQKMGEPTKAQEFIEPLLITVSGLQANTKFLTTHGQAILKSLADALAEPQFAKVLVKVE